MNHIISYFLLSVIVFSNYSCGDNKSIMMKPATGKPGETVIVIADEYWKGIPGDTMFHYLSQPHIGLPRDEPILDIVNIPPAAFKEIFKTSRNIILTKISSQIKEPSIKIQRDIWAAPQMVITIQAPNIESFANYFSKNANMVIAAFIKIERERLMNTYSQRKFKNKEVYKVFKDSLNFYINMPKGYTFAKYENGFAWIRYEARNISQGIFAYCYPYTSDSTFTLGYIISKRDSLLRKYVPGPTEGTWMTTEKQYKPTYKSFKLNGNYSAEVRGLWKVEGDYMGGPFLSITTLDTARQRIVTLEGYVYAPKHEKREYLRQLEAMIYSLRFPEQKMNEKINNMYESGEPDQ